MGSISPPKSRFLHLSQVPLDPHYALKELFQQDKHAKKVILGSGLYRDDNCKPWVLPSVKSVPRDILLGPLSADVKECTVTLQTISGTGANSLGARFLSEALKPRCVWLSDPSWVNHQNIWSLAGVETKLYPYWNATKRILDFSKMITTLESQAAAGDVILLHACAHNPTGVDPTKEQWERIADVCEDKGLFPFFDCAYQGFATGNLDEDAWAVRHFLERGTMEIAVAQSFSKNMGLYGERTGALHLVVASSGAAGRVKGHLARLQRGSISQPPTRGCKLAATILNHEDLFKQWLSDLQAMSSRIQSMRDKLAAELARRGTPGDWSHIRTQIGMFSYTGLTPDQVAHVQANSHVYILKSGRISVAGRRYSCELVDVIIY
ncbi:pyridoxal phosphate-dependent transferase [Pyrenochaeta sp. MPI-SDFR-AT-0127]|nr:pyridoxal phosphate-dependent transferase [Pyrenochaeta sp. MPI-SDFR-AT-0127]